MTLVLDLTPLKDTVPLVPRARLHARQKKNGWSWEIGIRIKLLKH